MKEITKLTLDEWIDQFEPLEVTGSLVLFDEASTEIRPYEPYSEEGTYILGIANRGKAGLGVGNVWTEIDGEDGVYIIEGYHLVNRIGYHLTKHAADPKFFYEVLVEKYERMEA